MKNAFKTALIAAAIFSVSSVHAQTHKDSTLGHKIGKDAKMVGHKTAHIAASGAAAVTDKKYDGKAGPQGQTIYINKNSHYFYVNSKGHRVYLKKSQLMDKPSK
jgi:hypothetical protein